MRWKERRCVSQSCRFAIVVCAFWFYFRFVYSTIHFSSHFSSQVQQSYLAQHNQVSVFCWSRTIFHYFRILEILYVCTNLHSWNHHEPWIFSSETILIITWRKMKVACPTLKYYAHLPDTCNYVKKSSSFTNNWKKSTTSKITTVEF